MGPQLVRCGMLGLKIIYMANREGFNGAATCSLRNAGGTALDLKTAAGFNGAATCSLRNELGLFTSADNFAQLQWGRNLFVAECENAHCVSGVPDRFNGAATCSLRNEQRGFLKGRQV